MIRMTLADYAKIHGQAKAASDFGVIQCAISKAILAGRNIMVIPQKNFSEVRPARNRVA
ncbi:TPA: Cro/Cl family transcriptional regulator [Escherichia coli]|nr:Cro/Cl family transcriptional regulator [Escherichia coli]